MGGGVDGRAAGDVAGQVVVAGQARAAVVEGDREVVAGVGVGLALGERDDVATVLERQDVRALGERPEPGDRRPRRHHGADRVGVLVGRQPGGHDPALRVADQGDGFAGLDAGLGHRGQDALGVRRARAADRGEVGRQVADVVVALHGVVSMSSVPGR